MPPLGGNLIQQFFDLGGGVYAPGFIPMAVTGSSDNILADPMMAINYGLIPGYTEITAFGENPNISSASVPEDIWNQGGLYPWMTGATSLQVRSTSASDTALGTGSRTVLVLGLDINYNTVSAFATLNGTTPVVLSQQLFRINDFVSYTSGSNEVNVGDLFVEDVGGGTIRGKVGAGLGVGRQSMYTCPAGYTGQLTNMTFCLNAKGTQTASGQSVDITPYVRIHNQGVYALFSINVVDQQTFLWPIATGFNIAEKTDFWLRVTHASSNNLGVTTAIEGYRRDNSL
jgi:hypothetical protein